MMISGVRNIKPFVQNSVTQYIIALLAFSTMMGLTVILVISMADIMFACVRSATCLQSPDGSFSNASTVALLVGGYASFIAQTLIWAIQEDTGTKTFAWPPRKKPSNHARTVSLPKKTRMLIAFLPALIITVALIFGILELHSYAAIVKDRVLPEMRSSLVFGFFAAMVYYLPIQTTFTWGQKLLLRKGEVLCANLVNKPAHNG